LKIKSWAAFFDEKVGFKFCCWESEWKCENIGKSSEEFRPNAAGSKEKQNNSQHRRLKMKLCNIGKEAM
jgi:hypothetical protein